MKLTFTGEYVAVEKVENEYKQLSCINQIWVYGRSTETCLVAIVVPSKDKIMEWAGSNGLGDREFEEVENKSRYAESEKKRKGGDWQVCGHKLFQSS